MKAVPSAATSITLVCGMPKVASKQSSVDKSRITIRQAMKRGESSLKFFSYEDKSMIMYKLNKYHYLDTNKIVVDLHVIKYLAQLAAKDNSIEQICFDLCSIRDQGCLEFLKGNWNNLLFLDLNSNGLTRIAVEAIVKPGNLAKLKQLTLNDNLLDATAGGVLAMGNWKHLQMLCLNFNSLGDQGLKNLSSHNWLRLKELHLLNNNITNAGITGLVNMQVTYLQKLLLSNNLITDDGCKVLARGQWKQLKTLQIEGNVLKDDALLYLVRLGCYNLGSLRVFSSKTCMMGADRKTEAVPSMGGLSWLVKGCWMRLEIELTLNKFGGMTRDYFISSNPIREMLELANVTVTTSTPK